MSFKNIVFYAGCIVAWTILPLLVISGGMMLVGAALLAEIHDFLVGSAPASLDRPTAREIARRLCH